MLAPSLFPQLCFKFASNLLGYGDRFGSHQAALPGASTLASTSAPAATTWGVLHHAGFDSFAVTPSALHQGAVLGVLSYATAGTTGFGGGGALTTTTGAGGLALGASGVMMGGGGPILLAVVHL